MRQKKQVLMMQLSSDGIQNSGDQNSAQYRQTCDLKHFPEHGMIYERTSKLGSTHFNAGRPPLKPGASLPLSFRVTHHYAYHDPIPSSPCELFGDGDRHHRPPHCL